VRAGLARRELIELGGAAVVVAGTAAARFLHAPAVATFLVAALALALLARLVGAATEQLGGRLGPSRAGAVQSALGNLPELVVSLFALGRGLTGVVQAALVGSVLANSVLVLGLAFIAGGLRNGPQRFHSSRARLTATLTTLAAATLAVPTLAHTLHEPAGAHGRTLSFVCAGVLLTVFLATLPSYLEAGAETDEEGPRWPLATTIGVLAGSAGAAVLVSDWFVGALQPAVHSLHMSQAFAGLVIVAIAGNAVENVVGVQLALRNQADFAVSVIVNSSLQVALALTPVLVFVSLAFSSALTLVFAPLLAVSLLLAAVVGAAVVYDGESTWPEGVVLVGLYVVIAASFWWGA
jgi:Ca2+:H+ antiporter